MPKVLIGGNSFLRFRLQFVAGPTSRAILPVSLIGCTQVTALHAPTSPLQFTRHAWSPTIRPNSRRPSSPKSETHCSCSIPNTDRLLEVNAVALRLTGYSRSELLDLPASLLFRFETPNGSQRLKARSPKRWCSTGKTASLLRARKDEAWVPVSLTISRLHVTPKTLGLIIARDDRERRAAPSRSRSGWRRNLHGAGELAGGRSGVPNGRRGRMSSAGGSSATSRRCWRIVGRSRRLLRPPVQVGGRSVHPLDSEAYRTRCGGMLISGTGLEQLYRGSKLAVVRWVRDRFQVVRDASGRPIRLNGCVMDVTEQWRAEEALRQSEERFPRAGRKEPRRNHAVG